MKRRRLWVRAARLLLLTVLMMAVVLGLLRLVLNDARIGRFLQHLATAELGLVRIDGLRVSLISGFEVGPVVVGPAPGFATPPLRIEKVLVRWSLWEALRLKFRVSEAQVQGVHVVIEQGPEGSNIDHILQRLSRPSDAPTATAAMPRKKLRPEDLVLPHVPARIELTEAVVEDVTVELKQPGRRATIDGLWGRLRFWIEGNEMALDATCGLGTPEQLSTLTFHSDNSAIDVTAQQRFTASFTMDSLQSFDVSVSHHADIDVSEPLRLPTLSVAGGLHARGRALEQLFRLDDLSWALGDAGAVDAAIEVTRLFDEPVLAIYKLEGKLDLVRLAPWVHALDAETDLAGKVYFRLAPVLQARVVDLWARQTPDVSVAAGMEGVTARRGSLVLNTLDAQVGLEWAHGQVTALWNASLVSATAFGAQLIGLSSEGKARADIAEILGMTAGQGAPRLTLSGSVRFDRAMGFGAEAQGLVADASVDVPWGFVLGEPQQARLSAQGTLGRVEAGPVAVDRLSFRLSGDVGDLRATRVRGSASAEIAQIASGDFQLSQLALASEFARVKDHLDVKGTMALAETLKAGLTVAARDFLSQMPIIEKLEGTLEPFHIEAMLRELSPRLRPPFDVTGQVSGAFSISGPVDLAVLRGVPRVALAPGAGADELLSQVAGLSAWARAHLGLELAASLALDDVALRHTSAAVAGLSMKGGVRFSKLGLQLEGQGRVGRVVGPGPATLSDVSFSGKGTLVDSTLEVAGELDVETVEHPMLVGPARQGHAQAELRYVLGGDLELRGASARLAQPTLELLGRGSISRPVKMVMARAWEDPRMAQLAAELSGSASWQSPELLQLYVDGPQAMGMAGAAAEMSLRDGVLKLDAELTCTNLSAAFGPHVLENASGRFPVTLGVSLRDDARGVALPFEVPLGSRHATLLTAEADTVRSVYYERLRPYRANQGLHVDAVRSRDYEAFDISVEGAFKNTTLSADRISLGLLGGDVVGRFALHLADDQSIRLDTAFQVSNVDASYFKALDLKPGADAEASADLRVGVLLSPSERDVSLDVNVTKISGEAMDRFVQLLDPQGKNESLQKQRQLLKAVKWGVVRIHNITAWVRHENFNFNMNYAALLDVLPTFEYRRHSIAETLDVMAQPLIDSYAVKFLGWPERS